MAILGKIISAPLKALGIIPTPGQAPTALPTAT